MKRFYKQASIGPVEGGFGVLLDGRVVKTPAKAILCLPKAAMADALAAEWNAQLDLINTHAMPMNRYANTAIDRTRTNRAHVQAEIAGFGGTDLLCYRATYPSVLVEKQGQGWDPILAWLANTHGAKMNTAQGIMAIDQDEKALMIIAGLVGRYDDFALSALHEATHILGSIILALALFEGRLLADEVWQLSRLDEDYQAAQWGEDLEATRIAATKKQAVLDAFAFYELSK